MNPGEGVSEYGKGAESLMRERDRSRTFAALRRENFEFGKRFSGIVFPSLLRRNLGLEAMEGYAQPSVALMDCMFRFCHFLKWPTAEAAAASEV
jgi:hypothetical protein